MSLVWSQITEMKEFRRTATLTLTKYIVPYIFPLDAGSLKGYTSDYLQCFLALINFPQCPTIIHSLLPSSSSSSTPSQAIVVFPVIENRSSNNFFSLNFFAAWLCNMYNVGLHPHNTTRSRRWAPRLGGGKKEMDGHEVQEEICSKYLVFMTIINVEREKRKSLQENLV